MSSDAARVGAVDLVYYAPHVLSSAQSAQDVHTIVGEDHANLATDLRAFLADGAEYARNARGFGLPRTDDSDAEPALIRTRFRFWELERDIRGSHESTFLRSAAPTSPTELELRPTLTCSVTESWLDLGSDAADYAANFAPDHAIFVRVGTATGRVRLVIESIDASRLLVRGVSGLAGATEVVLVGVESADAARVLASRAFHDARAKMHGAVDGANGVESGVVAFNENLYRLLYSPAFPQLADMGVEELYEHYTARPGSVGNVGELQSVADAADPSFVESRLTLGPGAAIQFSAPLNGTVSGLVTAPRAVTGLERFSGVSGDALLPTQAAVARMIDDAVPDPAAERITRFLEVAGVMYASEEFDGVHCTATLDAEGDVRCSAFTCRERADAREVTCHDLTVSGAIHANDAVVRALDVGDGAMNASQTEINIRAPRLAAPTAILDELRVTTMSELGPEVRAGTLAADRVDVASDIACDGMLRAMDARVLGALSVDDHVSCRSLDVNGLDVVAELTSLRGALAALTARQR